MKIVVIKLIKIKKRRRRTRHKVAMIKYNTMFIDWKEKMYSRVTGKIE